MTKHQDLPKKNRPVGIIDWECLHCGLLNPTLKCLVIAIFTYIGRRKKWSGTIDELAAEIGVSPRTINFHLKLLKKYTYITTSKSGNRNTYEVDYAKFAPFLPCRFCNKKDKVYAKFALMKPTQPATTARSVTESINGNGNGYIYILKRDGSNKKEDPKDDFKKNGENLKKETIDEKIAVAKFICEQLHDSAENLPFHIATVGRLGVEKCREILSSVLKDVLSGDAHSAKKVYTFRVQQEKKEEEQNQKRKKIEEGKNEIGKIKKEFEAENRENIRKFET